MAHMAHFASCIEIQVRTLQIAAKARKNEREEIDKTGKESGHKVRLLLQRPTTQDIKMHESATTNLDFFPSSSFPSS